MRVDQQAFLYSQGLGCVTCGPAAPHVGRCRTTLPAPASQTIARHAIDTRFQSRHICGDAVWMCSLQDHFRGVVTEPRRCLHPIRSGIMAFDCSGSYVFPGSNSLDVNALQLCLKDVTQGSRLQSSRQAACVCTSTAHIIHCHSSPSEAQQGRFHVLCHDCWLSLTHC